MITVIPTIEMSIRRFPALEYSVNEAINTLCTNLLFAGAGMKKIMITSCRPHEGKSFISMNLMRSLALIGKKVVLVDFDLRASVLQGEYGIRIQTPDAEKYLGVTGYLSGKCEVKHILGKTDIENAYMILAGRTVMNSLPLLNTQRMENLLNELSEEFDIVLVDSTPIGTIIDAARVASVCDGTVFVVHSGEIRRQELKQSVEQIERTGTEILGYVLNKYDERKVGDGGYYRKQYYRYDSNSRKKKKDDLGIGLFW